MTSRCSTITCWCICQRRFKCAITGTPVRSRRWGAPPSLRCSGDAGGLLAPGEFPHPAAEKLLEKAQSDPSVFLIHPGVAVAIDVSGIAGPYQPAVRQGSGEGRQGLRIHRGSVVAHRDCGSDHGSQAGGGQLHRVRLVRCECLYFDHQAGMEWQGSVADERDRTSPFVLMTKQGETIEQALAEAGKQPNFSVFESTRFPEFLQKPGDNQQPGPPILGADDVPVHDAGPGGFEMTCAWRWLWTGVYGATGISRGRRHTAVGVTGVHRRSGRLPGGRRIPVHRFGRRMPQRSRPA